MTITKKKHALSRDSVKVYERDFYSHVLVNLVRYTLPIFSGIRGGQCGDAMYKVCTDTKNKKMQLN